MFQDPVQAHALAGSAALFAEVIKARRYKFGFGNECGYMRRYSLRGLGPNEDEYWWAQFGNFGSTCGGGGRDTHVEADVMESSVEAGGGDDDDR